MSSDETTNIMPSEPKKKTSMADFSFQFNAAREFLKVEKKIFNALCDIAKENKAKKVTPKSLGILVVLGVFDGENDHHITGLRQIGINPIQKYINICDKAFDKDVASILREGQDGAILVNRNGQIIGSRIYLVVDDSSLDVPEGCGTRHISAASFSTREDVIATFTLSEETSIVRNWKNGTFVEQYDPADE
jgi:DNA integrity scanning protein DisA with diadenylate cyclase activity